jgi:hypothetical protein
MHRKHAHLRSYLRKTVAVIASVSLFLTIIPHAPVLAEEGELGADPIDLALADGNYVGGEAIVCYLESAGKDADALTAQGSGVAGDLLASAETLRP